MPDSETDLNSDIYEAGLEAMAKKLGISIDEAAKLAREEAERTGDKGSSKDHLFHIGRAKKNLTKKSDK